MGESKIANYVERRMIEDMYISQGLMGGAELPSKDFNDYKSSGTYVNGGTSGFSNRPGSNPDNGLLIVHAAANAGVQIWIGGYAPYFAFRTFKKDVFSTWTSFKQS